MAESGLELDEQISLVRSQIAALRHRRSLLAASLWSSRKIGNRIKSLPKASSTKATKAANELDTHSKAILSHSIRSTTGITAFRVQDPDPSAKEDEPLLGIRIDIFSRTFRQFSNPCYLFFREDAEEGLKLYKHTIPAYVPLQNLLDKYILKPETGPEGEPYQQRQGLAFLVRAVRQELVAQSRRTAVFEELKAMAESKQGNLESVNLQSAAAVEMDLCFKKGVIARMRLGTTGGIQKVVVRSRNEAEMASGKRKRRLERIILGRDSHVDGLAHRLRVSPQK